MYPLNAGVLLRNPGLALLDVHVCLLVELEYSLQMRTSMLYIYYPSSLRKGPDYLVNTSKI